jgi:Tfp pilus assembly protein PilF
VFTVQDDIAKSVAETLSKTLGVTTPVPRYGTQSVEAYDAYLRGRALARAWVEDESRLPLASSELRRATELDPNYAEAWAELANVYGSIAYGAPSQPAEARAVAIPAMERAANRAIETGPDRWQSQAALGWVLIAHREWVKAGDAFESSRRLAAEKGAEVDESYCGFLYNTGRLREAMAVVERSFSIDPLKDTAEEMRTLKFLLGRREELRAAGLGPDASVRGMSWRFTSTMWALDEGGRDSAVFQRLRAEAAAMGLQPSAALAGAGSSAADELAIFRRALADPGPRDRGELGAMALYAGHYGDPALAVALLRRAFLSTEGNTRYWFLWFPELRETRRTPAFKDFIRDLGFVDLWRATGDWGDFCKPKDEGDFECF